MRSSSAKLRLGVLVLSGLWAVPCPASAAQVQQQDTMPPMQPAPAIDNQPVDNNDPMARARAEKSAIERNADRQKRLEQDTARLFALAQELKEEVGKSNKDTLSIDVVKKAGEIEKLAKSVKESMRDGR